MGPTRKLVLVFPADNKEVFRAKVKMQGHLFYEGTWKVLEAEKQ